MYEDPWFILSGGLILYTRQISHYIHSQVRQHGERESRAPTQDRAAEQSRHTNKKAAVQKPVPLSNQSLLRSSYTFTRFFSFGGLGTACAIIGGCRPPLYYSCGAVQRFENVVNVRQEGRPRRTVSERAERDGRHLQGLAPKTHASSGRGEV
jgi:hypothetical protein